LGFAGAEAEAGGPGFSTLAGRELFEQEIKHRLNASNHVAFPRFIVVSPILPNRQCV
jgi:hypothetical protein